MFGKNKSKDDKEESKKDRFKRIATRRVNDILYKLRLLGNCANTSVYDYNDEDKRKIFSAIDEELRRAKLAFNKKSKKQEGEFNL